MFTEIKTILYQETGYYVSDLAWNSPKDGFAAGRSASSCAHRYGSGCGCRKMGEHHDAHWRWIGGHNWWGDDRDGQTERSISGSGNRSRVSTAMSRCRLSALPEQS